MNDTTAHIATLDQADEDILTYTASDEALEAAAGIERMAATLNEPICRPTILLWC
jgi:hypothetical protein